MATSPPNGTPSEEIPREIRSALLEYDDSKNEGTEAYQYAVLPSDRKRIRLLRLYPGVLRSPQVLCKLFEAEFVKGKALPMIVGPDGLLTNKSVEYEALSWRWGDEENGEYAIMIRNDNRMYKKRVSQTLGLALKYLRRAEDRILWIDAICINQKDKEERSYQVSMMSLVYTRALQVCVWLGEDDENSQKAFKFIREDISHLKDFDRLCNDQRHAPKWRAFVGLMQRDWFSRRWVVQEIALAPTASVYCGTDELEWRELAIAVELFVEVETATHRLSELLRKDDKSRVVPNLFEHVSELGASLLVNATARIFREYQRGDQRIRGPDRRSLLSLEYLVTSLSIFDCGRPHDSVYALIAIARDASPTPPTSIKQKRQQALIAQVFGDQLEQKPYLLDYNSPYPDVCQEFVKFCIERCAKVDPLQALDVLCRPWAKDWRPGEVKVDEDKRSPQNTKADIIRRPQGADWNVAWSEVAQKLFEDEDLLKELVPSPVEQEPPQDSLSLAPNAPTALPSSSDNNNTSNDTAPHPPETDLSSQAEAGASNEANTKTSNEVTTETVNEAETGTVNVATTGNPDKAPAGNSNEATVGASSEADTGTANEVDARAANEVDTGTANVATTGNTDETTAGASTEATTRIANEATTGNSIDEVTTADPAAVSLTAWQTAWKSYKDQRQLPYRRSTSFSDSIRRKKTHKDTRTLEQYRKQCEKIAPVTSFISNAFPGHNEPPETIAPDRRPSLKYLQQGPSEEEKWRKEETDLLASLVEDPKLEDILRVKVKLKKIEQARTEYIKKKSPANGSPKIPTRPTKDERPVHTRIRELGLPSWVARIDGAPFDIFPHPGMDMMKMGRKNADPLVGIPQDGHRNYSAGQSKEVDLKTLQFRRRAHLGHYSLYLKGFCFDRVAKVAQVSQAGAIPASWLDLAGWPEARRPTGMHANLDDPPTAFWRTLVADRGRNDRNPPYYYARACKETILKGGIRSNAVDTTALIYNERNSIIAEFCRRVQAVIWNRALIKTEKGALGLVSEEVREGDLICIIYGCTTPVILRRENGKYFKTANEQRNEKLEDGMEAMKRLIVQVERYRDRALQYSQLDEEERGIVEKETGNYNKKYARKKERAEIEEEEKKKRDLDAEREKWYGKEHTQSDIDEEDSTSDIDEEAKIDSQDTEQNQSNAQQTQEQIEEKNREKEAREKERKRRETEKIERHKERQYKAKVRDPLRHYRFLDQAYIHGMMDGEAVRQKFYTGKPDHIFEIR